MNEDKSKSEVLYDKIVRLLEKANESAFVDLMELLADSLQLKFPDNLWFKYSFMEKALANGLTLDEALKAREIGKDFIETRMREELCK